MKNRFLGGFEDGRTPFLGGFDSSYSQFILNTLWTHYMNIYTSMDTLIVELSKNLFWDFSSVEAPLFCRPFCFVFDPSPSVSLVRRLRRRRGDS